MPLKNSPSPQPAIVIKYACHPKFGRIDRRIVDSTQHFVFKELTGRTVLLDRDIKALGKLGIVFEEVV